MTAAALVADLRARGVTLVADGNKLRCRPKSALSAVDLAALAELKPQIIAALQAPKTDTVAAPIVCYSCRSGRFWRSTSGVVICANCHPPAAPDLVSGWLGVGEDHT